VIRLRRVGNGARRPGPWGREGAQPCPCATVQISLILANDRVGRSGPGCAATGATSTMAAPSLADPEPISQPFRPGMTYPVRCPGCRQRTREQDAMLIEWTWFGLAPCIRLWRRRGTWSRFGFLPVARSTVTEQISRVKKRCIPLEPVATPILPRNSPRQCAAVGRLRGYGHRHRIGPSDESAPCRRSK